MSTLDDIKARAEKATPGPWQVWDDAPAHRSAYVETTWSTDGEHKEEITDWCKPADAEFIANARMDVPKLVAALEAVLSLAEHEPRFSRAFGGGHLPNLVMADSIIEVIAEALA